MKKIILLLCATQTFIAGSLLAQTPTVCPLNSTEQCTLQLGYDNAGNRISRQKVCVCIGQGSRIAQGNNSSNNNTNNVAETASIIKLYPNPTTDAVNIVFSEPLRAALLTVSDAVGKTIATYTVSGIEYTLDLSAFPSGMYYIALQSEQGSITQKLVKTDK